MSTQIFITPALPLTRIIDLKDYDIKAMGTTPISLMPSASATKYFIVSRVLIECSIAGEAFTFTSPVFQLNGCFHSFIDIKMLNAIGDSVSIITANITDNVGAADFRVKNNADSIGLDLVMSTLYGDNSATGKGAMKITITYTEHTFMS